MNNNSVQNTNAPRYIALDGKAYFKQQLALWVSRVDISSTTNAEWIDWLRQQKQHGGPLSLATTVSEPNMAKHFRQRSSCFRFVIKALRPSQLSKKRFVVCSLNCSSSVGSCYLSICCAGVCWRLFVHRAERPALSPEFLTF